MLLFSITGKERFLCIYLMLLIHLCFHLFACGVPSIECHVPFKQTVSQSKIQSHPFSSIRNPQVVPSVVCGDPGGLQGATCAVSLSVEWISVGRSLSQTACVHSFVFSLRLYIWTSVLLAAFERRMWRRPVGGEWNGANRWKLWRRARDFARCR